MMGATSWANGGGFAARANHTTASANAIRKLAAATNTILGEKRPGNLLARQRHYRRHLAKNAADAAGNARHDSAGGDCYEASHQGVFDEILAAAIAPGPNQKKQCSIIDHFQSFWAVFLAAVISVMSDFGPANGLGQSGR